jgi:hypothetical protein
MDDLSRRRARQVLLAWLEPQHLPFLAFPQPTSEHDHAQDQAIVEEDVDRQAEPESEAVR